MRKIKLTESELVSLIEKVVNETQINERGPIAVRGTNTNLPTRGGIVGEEDLNEISWLKQQRDCVSAMRRGGHSSADSRHICHDDKKMGKDKPATGMRESYEKGYEDAMVDEAFDYTGCMNGCPGTDLDSSSADIGADDACRNSCGRGKRGIAPKRKTSSRASRVREMEDLEESENYCVSPQVGTWPDCYIPKGDGDIPTKRKSIPSPLDRGMGKMNKVRPMGMRESYEDGYEDAMMEMRRYLN